MYCGAFRVVEGCNWRISFITSASKIPEDTQLSISYQYAAFSASFLSLTT